MPIVELEKQRAYAVDYVTAMREMRNAMNKLDGLGREMANSDLDFTAPAIFEGDPRLQHMTPATFDAARMAWVDTRTYIQDAARRHDKKFDKVLAGPR